MPQAHIGAKNRAPPNFITICAKFVRLFFAKKHHMLVLRPVTEKTEEEKLPMTDGALEVSRRSMRERRRHLTLKRMRANYFLYIFLLPAVVYLGVFAYGPMYGIQIAFKNFKASKGIWDSAWVGFKYFEAFFDSPRFWLLIKKKG